MLKAHKAGANKTGLQGTLGWVKTGEGSPGAKAVPASPAATGVGRNTLLVPIQFKIGPF